MGFILMYDITNEESYNSVQDWSVYLQMYKYKKMENSKLILAHRVTQIKTYSWDNAQVVLVGNKCDMEDERVISYERGRQLADQLGIEFFETSAKDNVNVKVSIFSKSSRLYENHDFSSKFKFCCNCNSVKPTAFSRD